MLKILEFKHKFTKPNHFSHSRIGSKPNKRILSARRNQKLLKFLVWLAPDWNLSVFVLFYNPKKYSKLRSHLFLILFLPVQRNRDKRNTNKYFMENYKFVFLSFDVYNTWMFPFCFKFKWIQWIVASCFLCHCFPFQLSWFFLLSWWYFLLK